MDIEPISFLLFKSRITLSQIPDVIKAAVGQERHEDGSLLFTVNNLEKALALLEAMNKLGPQMPELPEAIQTKIKEGMVSEFREAISPTQETVDREAKERRDWYKRNYEPLEYVLGEYHKAINTYLAGSPDPAGKAWALGQMSRAEPLLADISNIDRRTYILLRGGQGRSPEWLAEWNQQYELLWLRGENRPESVSAIILPKLEVIGQYEQVKNPQRKRGQRPGSRK